MLHIILLLLKIIGILLLFILGLILLILLTTLFVPIRYRVAAQHGEDLFYLKGRVNWLLHIVHLSFSHIEGLLHIRARLFGFIIYDNLKPKKPKEAKKKAKNKKAANRKAANRKAANRKAANRKADLNVEAERMNSQEPSSTAPELTAKSSMIVSESNEVANESIITPKAEDTAGNKNTIDEMESGVSNTSNDRNKPERISFIQKLKERIRSLREKIVSTFLEWKAKILRIFATVSSFWHKLDLILNFLRDELNKEGMHITFSSLKKLIKHILPTKLKSKLTFGTGDPCSTGQALGAISILYSFYGDKLQITPDFERNILEGEHFASGRIRLVTILIIVVKLILDKRFKQLKNNFMILKEAL